MKYIRKAWLFFVFLLFYLKEMVKANVQLARDILSPKMHIHPGIVKVHINAKNGRQTLALFNLVTMTPGSLCLDVSDDHSCLYIHGLYVKSHDEFEKEIIDGIEKKMLEVFE
jgi:multicomponent Na+:H+ antiporter subunit E